MTRIEFEKAVEASRGSMVARARRWLNADDADDIVQDAMLKAFTMENWERVRQPRHFLLSVVENAVADKKDKSKRRTGIEQKIEETAKHEALGDGDIVDALLENAEIAEKVGAIMGAAALAGLSMREDYIFLAKLRDVSNEEIAQTLGTNVDSVRASYSWALRKIRAVMLGEGEFK